MTLSHDAIIIGTGQAGPALAGRLTAAGMGCCSLPRGQVLVEGRPTREWDPIQFKRHIGYVIQDVGLFS